MKYEIELAACSRCEEMVDEETLIIALDWKLCEICWGDV